METLTLHQQSTIRGVVLGKAVFCTLRGSPPGLRLAAGDYLLRPAQNSPVYGLVMPIEPLARVTEGTTAVKFANPSAVKFSSDPSAVKFSDPSAIKFRPPTAPAIKFDTAAAPAIKFDTAAAPAIKFDTAAAPAVKFDTAAAIATLGLPQSAPAVKFDTVSGQANQPVVISERRIAGNSVQATAGFGDLVDAVLRAGAVKLVVV